MKWGCIPRSSAAARSRRFFDIDLNEAHHGFSLPSAYDVDYNKRAEIDASNMEPKIVNLRIRELMQDGFGTIVIKNPGAKHSLGVGILNRLNLIIDGSLGYFGLGLIDGPNVRIAGRVGWSCAENMMSGTILIEKNAGSQFGAAIRGGDLVCKGDVGSRTGIDMKGGTIIVGGDTGAFTGFMMQRGRMVICGNAGKNLGNSMYDGTIYIAGEPASLGVDAVWGEITELDRAWLARKLKHVRPVAEGRRGRFPQDRRRQAIVELRQSRADREETGAVSAGAGQTMSKTKNGKGGAKAPAEAKRFILGQEPDLHAGGHQRHPCEVGARPLPHARLLAVQEDSALGRSHLPARHADPLRHRGLSREMRHQDGDRAARPSGRWCSTSRSM